MSTFQVTAHFLSLRDDIVIPGSDLGAYKYYSRDSEVLEDTLEPFKKELCEDRGKMWKLSNRRPFKLREQLEELENILLSQSPVYAQWQTPSYMAYVFSSGVIVHIIINMHCGDLAQILIDRTMEGKLLSEITSVTVAKNTLYLTYGIPQFTVISSDKPIFNSEQPTLLSQSNLSVQDIMLPGPGTRRHERKLFANSDKSLLCIWWVREGSDLYAWSPIVRAEDRANILVYSLKPNNYLDIVACKRTENDPASLEFVSRDPTVLRLTEVIPTAKGRVSIVSTLFKVNEDLHQIQQRILRIGCPPRCFAYSPDDQLLFLGCVDGSLIMWNLARDTCISGKASFIPFYASWHSSSALLVISSDRGVLQSCDRALSCCRLQLRNSAPCKEQGGRSVIHLGQYLRMQPTAINLKWADYSINEDQSIPREDTSGSFKRSGRQRSYRSTRRKLKFKNKLPRLPKSPVTSAAAPVESLFILFERGPLLCLRFSTGCYPGSSSLDSLALCSEYLLWDLQEQAVQLLLSLNWSNVTSFQEEDSLLFCLTKVVNSLLRYTEGSAKAEKILENTIIQLVDIVQDNVALSAPVWDVARRCFRSFLRSGKLHTAAKVALRLQDPDLFVELILNAKAAGDQPLADHALAALDYLKSVRNESCSSSCTSSCDTCSESSSSHSSCCSSCQDEEEPRSERHSAVSSLRTINETMSELRISDDTEDQVRVVSFGIV